MSFFLINPVVLLIRLHVRSEYKIIGFKKQGAF